MHAPLKALIPSATEPSGDRWTLVQDDALERFLASQTNQAADSTSRLG